MASQGGREGGVQYWCRCSSARGQVAASQPCRGTDANPKERECIFPYYYEGKLYTECTLFEETGFVYPVFRCPTWNITTKIGAVSSFTFLELTQGYCVHPTTGELDPSLTCFDFLKVAPFSQCKNDCPGGGRPFLTHPCGSASLRNNWRGCRPGHGRGGVAIEPPSSAG